jgi:hypothetical protein
MAERRLQKTREAYPEWRRPSDNRAEQLQRKRRGFMECPTCHEEFDEFADFSAPDVASRFKECCQRAHEMRQWLYNYWGPSLTFRGLTGPQVVDCFRATGIWKT